MKTGELRVLVPAVGGSGLKAERLQGLLVAWTAANSGYVLKRGWLGMSTIGRCPRWIYWEQVDGKPNELGAKLRCYRGYLVEGDVKRRIALALDGRGRISGGDGEIEVTGLDGRFLGHVDGEIHVDGEQPVLLEIKSTTDERLAEIMDRQRIPEVHWMQVQCYLYFGDWQRAFVVYEAVGSGQIYVHEVQRDEGVGRRCEAKARLVLEALDKGEPPRCRCGHCQK